MAEWLFLLLLCAAAAALVLDATSIGQFMLSRPIVAGPVLGAAAGDGAQGFAIGAIVEFALMADLPVGAALPLNGAVAASLAVLLAAEPNPLAPGWALLLGLAGAWAYRPLEARLRHRRVRLAASIETQVRRGDEPGFAAAVGRSLAEEFGASAVFLIAAAAALKAIGGWWLLWPPVREGADFVWRASPIVAGVAAVHHLKPR